MNSKSPSRRALRPCTLNPEPHIGVREILFSVRAGTGSLIGESSGESQVIFRGSAPSIGVEGFRLGPYVALFCVLALQNLEYGSGARLLGEDRGLTNCKVSFKSGSQTASRIPDPDAESVSPRDLHRSFRQ